MSGGNWKELFAAAESGDLPLVEYHVRQGVDINRHKFSCLTEFCYHSTCFADFNSE